MTENMNLQQALYKRIKSSGKGIVDIKEGGRVSEMREGGDGRWVGLRIGDNDWVRGSLIVCLSSFAVSDSADDRSELMDPTHLFAITPRSRLMVMPTPPMQLSLQCIIPLHQSTQTIPLFNDSYLPAHSLSFHSAKKHRQWSGRLVPNSPLH